MGTILHPIAPMPTLPGSPGVRFRHYRGVDLDIVGMAAANQASRSADGEVEPIDVDEMRVSYQHHERCDPDRDICVIELDGEIAGYTRVFWDDLILESLREYFAVALLRPGVRRPEIRRAALDWSEQRRRAIAEGHRASGEALDRPLWLGTDYPDGDVETADLLRSSGYVPIRRFASLIRPDLEAIVDVPLPKGIETRPITRDTPLLRRIWEAEVEAFRDHFGAREPTERDWAFFMDEPGRDLALWFIAFDGEEVAGGVRCVVKPNAEGIREGWLEPVFTGRAWRRRGIARALIARSLVGLREYGVERAALGVDLQNPNQALRLYESSGFQVQSSSTGWRKPLILEEPATDGSTPRPTAARSAAGAVR